MESALISQLLGLLPSQQAVPAIAWSLAALYVMWILYVALQALDRARRAGLLSRTARVLSVPMLLIAGPLDVLINVTLGTLMFGQIPRELTLSQRLERHVAHTGWRGALARWIARSLLDPFEHDGRHIDSRG